jgi:hypothetical protein
MHRIFFQSEELTGKQLATKMPLGWIRSIETGRLKALLESARGQKQQIKEIASDNAPSAGCETSVCRGPSAKLKTPDFHLRVTLAISAVSVPAASAELLIFHFHESAAAVAAEKAAASRSRRFMSGSAK